ncbi:MAG: hypothetical protein HC915_14245 [Anaerolineae bacterium]|nr:hypothetical protein [Anaerolineae bacterium]
MEKGDALNVIGKLGFWLAWLVLLAACSEGQPFEDPSQRATRQAQATQIIATVNYEETRQPTLIALEATTAYVPAMATQVVMLEQQNHNLQGTLAALRPFLQPTPDAQNFAAATLDPLARAAQNYTDLTTANAINPATGCASAPNDTFYITGPNDPQRIYFSVRALDVRAGTIYQTRWYQGFESRYETPTWTADRDYAEVCIYFFLESSDAPYRGGFWSAELFANGTSVARIRFAMCEPGVFC